MPLLDKSLYGLVSARFVSRPNRFVIVARIGRTTVRAASRDPGRLRELLIPGVPLLLESSADPRRRTAYTAVLVQKGRRWVSLVPALANAIFAAAVAGGRAPGLRGASIRASEVTRGHSRFDFLVRHRGHDWLTEVKSASLLEGGRALFPDAPTSRGTRHVRELTAHARAGGRALVAFVVQCGGAQSLAPHAGHDPDFARALADAHRAGVRILAYACRVSPRGIAIARRIPVVFR